MFTTIEPRLIALLNNERPSPSYINPTLDLPPLHDPNILKSSGRPPPLEPDAIKRIGKLHHKLDLDASLPKLNNGAPIEETDNSRSIDSQKITKHVTDSGRALGTSSPQSLRKILDVVHEDDSDRVKKRPNRGTAKDDFVQLPQPVKKQKTAKQVVPPIIIGLFQPPPQAALFPPIASSSFHDSHGQYTLNTPSLQVAKLQDLVKDDKVEDKSIARRITPPAAKTRGKQARRKWTEEETKNLLLGVSKHGVGNWTDILTDKEFIFNKRSGADLKDRFRTCCPAEWREDKSTRDLPRKRPTSKSSLMSENILIVDDLPESNSGDTSTSKRKSKAHRKDTKELAQLGIGMPFQKSLRRERKPFTDQEDSWILEGFNMYGPAWSRIQKDSRFQLQNRQATDLRDRFRNKFPERFRKEMEKHKEKEKEQVVESRPHVGTNSSFDSSTSRPTTSSAHDKPTIQDPHTIPTISSEPESRQIPIPAPPTISRDNLSIQHILTDTHSPSRSNTQYNLKDILTFSDPTTLDSDTLPFTQSFDWTNPIIAPLDEMGISRLLLDEDSWPDVPGKERQTFTNINSIISVNEESGGFLNLLGEERESWSET